jgi:hypothetical protein
MKLQSLLSRLAVLGVAAAVTGLVLDTGALALFSAAAAVLLLLVASHDYGRRPRLARSVSPAGRRPESMPLAA